MLALRFLNVMLGYTLLLYWMLSLLGPIFTCGPPDFDKANIKPCASVAPSLNHIPVAFFLKNFSVIQTKDGIQGRHTSCYNRITASLRVGFLLLLLSGDIELNPGPIATPKNPPLKFSQLNARSVLGSVSVDKPSLIQNYILENNIDILALSETWLRPDSLPAMINSVTPDGYICMHVPRPEGRGGGVAFIYRSVFEFRPVKYPKFSSFELVVGKLVCKSSAFIFANIYRPPSGSVNAFLDDFSSLLEDVGTAPSDIFVSGDCNIHLDELDPTTTKFLNLLDIFDLKQLIDFPTHDAGHILDLFICRSRAISTISNFLPTFVTFSDHMAVSCDISVPSLSRLAQTTRRFRIFRYFKVAEFNKALLESGINFIADIDLDLYVNTIMSSVKSLLDVHFRLGEL